MTHKFACCHGPNYNLYYWEIPCYFFRFSQEVTLAKMSRVLFISTENNIVPDAKEIKIHSDSLALFTPVVNKLMHRLWLKALRMLHLMLIFCLKYVSFETLVCSGEVTNLGWFVDCQLWEKQNKKNPEETMSWSKYTDTDKIYLFSILVVGGWLTFQVTVLCLCNYRIIMLSITE